MLTRNSNISSKRRMKRYIIRKLRKKRELKEIKRFIEKEYHKEIITLIVHIVRL